MSFEEHFKELDRLLLSKSTDYDKMRSILQGMRRLRLDERKRKMEFVMDHLYASIARGHRKALVHLEAGNTAAAMQESAKATAWFYTRFRDWDTTEPMMQYPQISEEYRALRELASRSEIFRDAVKNTKGHEIHDP